MTVGAALFLVALCGGYYFVSVFIPTKYGSARETGHRFYLRVAHYTIWLAFGSSLILFGIVANLPQSWYNLVIPIAGPFPAPATYSEFLASPLSYGVAPLTLLLAIVSSHCLNALLQLRPGAKNRVLINAVSNRDFEKLVLYAQKNEKPLLLTLETGEVYVGLVVYTPEPTLPREYLRIAPVFSGYRERETQRVVLSINYDTVIKKLADPDDDELSHLKKEDFEAVIPAERIVSAHIFDHAVRRLLWP